MYVEIRLKSRPHGREPPDLPGFEQDDNRWQLDLDYYQTFIADVTGIEIGDSLSKKEMKTIQTRLEGCIEGYRRDGECLCDDFEKYENVDSIKSAHELSQFFRTLVASRVERSEVVQ